MPFMAVSELVVQTLQVHVSMLSWPNMIILRWDHGGAIFGPRAIKALFQNEGAPQNEGVHDEGNMYQTSQYCTSTNCTKRTEDHHVYGCQ
jgi:hypothetical protein